MAQRFTLQDFLSAIRTAASAAGKYGASLNTDGSVKVFINATGAVSFSKVWYNVRPAGYALTDANSNSGDGVTICDADGSNARVGDCQTFLNSLT
jgi:hypothetical protein